MLSEAAIHVVKTLNQFGPEAARDAAAGMKGSPDYDEDVHLVWLSCATTKADRDAAMVELEATIEASPTPGTLALGWMVHAKIKGVFQSRYAWLEQAHTLAPDNLFVLRAQIHHLTMSRKREAIEFIRIGQEKYPFDTRFWRDEGLYLARNEGNAAGLAFLESLSDHLRLTFTVLSLTSVFELRQRNLQRATEVTQSVLELAPRSVSAWTTLARCLFLADAPKEAVSAAEQAITLDPQAGDALRVLATAYRRLGRDQDHASVIQRLKKLEGPDDLVLQAIGLLERKRPQEAEAILRKLTAHESASTRQIVARLRLRGFLDREMPVEARKLLEDGELDLGTAFDRTLEAEILLQEGDSSFAVELLERELAGQHPSPRAFILLMRHYHATGLTEDLEAILTRVDHFLDSDPDSVGEVALIILEVHRIGRHELVSRWTERALCLRPDSMLILALWAKLRSRDGKTADAFFEVLESLPERLRPELSPRQREMYETWRARSGSGA